MPRILSLITVLALAACGVDGKPVPPEAAPKPGVTVTGDASAGIVLQ